MIVVAITNTDRTRDLTPTNSLTEPGGKHNEEFKNSGGGEQFISFIEKELMPHVDSLYPTALYKVLIGHSFGALTVVKVLINHTKLFNAYVAIDPSMWWDQQKLLQQAG
ncbi:alpha/beta hydrolase [Mucilaginibacter robiniae]|uniref:Alpha/beta hydrolase n=1 Tax=Mucilaginibacter robiniae TaxID=2728022 RepID=A0A7L5DXM5_9SPHI|nr:alpha/beta hydrolase-fold protein [Mucilaginibacter robiniae]QJD94769.1 alpha/beta hydrolase [Mucilaginibacter robiniae]